MNLEKRFRKQPEPTELEKNAEMFRRVFSNPEAFDTLVILAVKCKWLGHLDTPEDVVRYNLFSDYLAYFGHREGGFGWTDKELRSALQVFVGRRVNTEMKGEPTDVRL